MRTLTTIWILTSAMLVSACATEPTVLTETQVVEVPIYEIVPVPEVLLRACKVDLSALESNADLERALVESHQCNVLHEEDKEQIRSLNEHASTGPDGPVSE